MFRTSIQCAAWCTDYEACVAFQWEEQNSDFLCKLISRSGLCLDIEEINPTKVFVDQGNIPPACKGKFRKSDSLIVVDFFNLGSFRLWIRILF